MTIIELFFFLALPTSVAFCFVFPLPDAFRLAAVIGAASAALSAASLFALVASLRLLRGRWSDSPAFPPWGLLATVFASAGAAFFSWHSRLSLFGIVAFAAASLAVYGTGRRSILGWSGLVISVIVALVLHVLLRRSNIV